MILLAAALTVQVWDFALDTQDASSYGTTSQWEWGQATSGPMSGSAVWGTGLDQNYLHSARDYLEVSLGDLSTLDRPVLRLQHWFDAQAGDVGSFEVDDGSGWTEIVPVYGYDTTNGFTGTSGGWIETSVDLSSLSGDSAFRLVFTSDDSGASDGWYVSDMTLFDGDATPPLVVPVSIPDDTQDLEGPYVVQVLADDDTAVLDLTLHASYGGLASFAFPMADTGSGIWEGELPGTAPDTTISLWIEADDGEQTARWPESGSEEFRVYLAAPRELEGPAGRLVAQEVELSWLPPITPHTVLGYQLVPLDLSQPAIDVVEPRAVVPIRPGDATDWVVYASYEEGLGDPSEVLTLDVEVPELNPLQPDRAYQGDQVHLEITGRSLYLLNGVTQLQIDGVQVEHLDVLDVNTAQVLVSVAEDASPGLRDMMIEGGHGSFKFGSVFEVLDGTQRPDIVSVEPSTIIQAATEWVTVTASESFAALPTVQVDDDLLVVAESWNDNVVELSITAYGDALVGSHSLVLDDGVRLWTADLTVNEYVSPPQTTCDVSGSAGVGWGAWLVLWALGRRQRRDTAS
jgi:hypothetical protein